MPRRFQTPHIQMHSRSHPTEPDCYQHGWSIEDNRGITVANCARYYLKYDAALRDAQRFIQTAREISVSVRT